MDKNIPLQNLVKQNASIREQLINTFAEVIDSGRYVSGPGVENFENEFANYVGAKFGVGLSSGSSAVELALKANGIESGDEVIVPSLTFIATIEAILEADAIPVVIDIDPKSWNIDPLLIEQAITKKTKAIVPVHLHGRLAEMDSVLSIAKKNNLKVIEDSAQAHGASRGIHKAGSCSDAAAFSFYPGKNLGAYGDGGGIGTNNSELNDKIRKIMNLGCKIKYHHELIGRNSRLDTIQASFLNVKLKYLDECNELRRKNADIYIKNLKHIKKKKKGRLSCLLQSEALLLESILFISSIYKTHENVCHHKSLPFG